MPPIFHGPKASLRSFLILAGCGLSYRPVYMFCGILITMPFSTLGYGVTWKLRMVAYGYAPES